MNLETATTVRMEVTSVFVRLAGARVSLCADACLALFAPPVSCVRCAGACPVNALHVGEVGPQLTNPCLGCGQCAAACPTGALRVEGFESTEPLPPGNQPWRVECRKVPESATRMPTLHVPCLHGIGLEQILEPECRRHRSFAQDLFGARRPGAYPSEQSLPS